MAGFSTEQVEQIAQIVAATLSMSGGGGLAAVKPALASGVAERDRGGVSAVGGVVDDVPDGLGVGVGVVGGAGKGVTGDHALSVGSDGPLVVSSDGGGFASSVDGVRSGSVSEGSVSDGSVKMPGRVRQTSVEALKRITFGEGVVASPGFFKTHVKIPAVVAYADAVHKLVGVKLPKGAMSDLALVRYTVGTVPDAFVRGQDNIKALAAVGDAALSMVLIERMYRGGQPVKSMQAARGDKLSNATMTRTFVEFGLADHIQYPPGVNKRTSKATPDAFEALAGVLYLSGGLPFVAKYGTVLGCF